MNTVHARAALALKRKLRKDRWHVQRDMDAGSHYIQQWLPFDLAVLVANAYQGLEDHRRSKSPNPLLRDDPAAFDVYTVVEEPSDRKYNV